MTAVLQIGVPAGLLTVIIVLLAAAVLAVRRGFATTETVTVNVNDREQMSVRSGDTLLETLARENIRLPSACGGRGTCGQCRVTVTRGGGTLLPTESNHIDRAAAAAGTRLACMVRVRGNIEVQVPTDALSAGRWRVRVRSSRNLSTYLREIVLDLPDGASLPFQAGDYVLVEAPPATLRFANFTIEPEYRGEWSRLGLDPLQVTIAETTTRAYSLANHPREGSFLTLVVRIALPPHDAPRDAPPGRVSSYLFSLQPGDEINVSGPFGEFNVRDSNREMVLIGGGAGVAPLRSIVRDQLVNKHTRRRMSLWYGSNNLRELCYADEFSALAAAHDNFSYHVALSAPDPQDNWQGATGFIHTVTCEQYLAGHRAPEEAEYYLCGPPLMTSAAIGMLEDLGVDQSSIFLDDFGAAAPPPGGS